MHIYPPSDANEFGLVVGNLSEEEFSRFEQRLRNELPDVRYLKVPDKKGFFATSQRFSLAIHREDRQRALSVIWETKESFSPTPGLNQRIAWAVRRPRAPGF